LELLTEQGSDGFLEAMRILLNAAMLFERERGLQAAPYERTSQPRDYANGFKPKSLRTRLGELDLRIPQARPGDFYPQALARGTRSERAVQLALAEMDVQGVSTRKVKAITEQLCGFEVTSSQVARAVAEVDEHFKQWRERPLRQMAYRQFDARDEKVREGGLVIDEALLQAIGIDREGRRHVLGRSVSRSEAERHWREFLQSLVASGLGGVELITSDSQAGLEAARKAVFAGVPWQRCQFHLQQNASQYVTRIEQRKEVAADLRAIFNAPGRVEGDRLLAATVKKYAETMPRLSAWLEAKVDQGLTVMSFPVEHQRRLRTTNLSERVNREVKRRTRVVGVFPNAAALERLATAVLMEIDEDWQSGTRYLSFLKGRSPELRIYRTTVALS
jgi:transposase-like protein